MTRVLLVAAMAFSLWPIGAILLLGGNDEQAPTNPPESLVRIGGQASPALPQLESITARGIHLDKRFGNVELHAEEPRMVFAYTAWSIEEDLRRWLSARHEVASSNEIVVAKKMIGLLRSLGRLAEEPTGKRLHVYNRAVEAFETAIS